MINSDEHSPSVVNGQSHPSSEASKKLSLRQSAWPGGVSFDLSKTRVAASATEAPARRALNI